MRNAKLWLMTIVLLLCSLMVSAQTEVNGIYYNLFHDMTAVVTYRGSYANEYFNEYTGEVTIPSTITYEGNTYRVTSIDNYTFYQCEYLTSIIIPEGVTSIGDDAFWRCCSLNSIIFPASLTWIGNNAFYDCYSLNSIILPESVTHIGKNAFSGCPIATITLPEGITSIENGVFSWCGSLNSITIPNGVTSIGQSAFSGCSNLSSIIIPESVTNIDNYAFSGCYKLHLIINHSNLSLSAGASEYGEIAYYAKLVINPEEIVSVGDFQFYTSDNVHYLMGYTGQETGIVLPEDFNGESYELGASAFSNRNEITSITIPENITSIGNSAFFGCSSLTSITIPRSVTSIGDNAFSGCSELAQVTIDCANVDSWFCGNSSIKEIILGENVTSIGEYAFRNCKGITSITIPCSVTSIEQEAFAGCVELKDIIFEDGIETLSLVQQGSYYGNTLFYDCPLEHVYLGRNLSISGWWELNSPFHNANTIEIGNSVTAFADYTFANCSKLISINIPKGITEIGYEAFEGCDNLAQITIDCTNIGSWFSGKSSIKEVILGENVKTIGDYAFSGCSGITSINIPEGVTSMGYGAFNRCESLAAVHINNLEAWCKIAFGGDGWHDSNSNPLSYAHNLYLNGDLVTELIIPEGVTSIRSQAFSGCTNITSVSIPESVTSIENEAFNGCENLAEVHINSLEAWCNIDFGSTPLSYAKNLYLNGELVTDLVIPSTITSIKSYAFKNCQNLTSVVIPEGVTSIGYETFSSCSNLTSVSIPETVTSIEGGAFSGCSSITAITIPESVTSIGYGAFGNCSNLTTINIPEGVTCIDNVFYGCSSLTAITIPENVTSIEYAAFAECSNLTSVAILGSLNLVDNNAFRNCNNLKEMVFGEKVRKIEAGAFAEVESLEKITVYATQPPRTDGDIFSDEVYDNATLYVPQGCISKYQVMTGWSGFYNISEIEGSTPNYLTIRQADNGAVKIAVDLGRTYKVQIEPTEGWAIHSVTFDGKDMTAQLDESYTFTTPTLTGSAVLNVAYEQVRVNKVVSVRSDAIKVRGYQDKLFISGTESGDHIAIYTVGGIAVAEVKTEGINTEISVESGQLYIVKVAGKVVKIQM